MDGMADLVAWTAAPLSLALSTAAARFGKIFSDSQSL